MQDALDLFLSASFGHENMRIRKYESATGNSWIKGKGDNFIIPSSLCTMERYELLRIAKITMQ